MLGLEVQLRAEWDDAAGIQPRAVAVVALLVDVDLTVRLVGPSVGEREAAIIANQIQQAMAAAGHALRSLVLDFTDVQVISSMGLGMCIDVRHQARQRQADSIVYGLSTQLRELFEMMKVDRLFRLVGDPAELDQAMRT